MARRAIVTEGLLSIADISRHFSLPESTTRYYCKRFSGFIPSVGEGRRRRYRPETLDVIAVILDQMQKSRTAAAVEDALHARFHVFYFAESARYLSNYRWQLLNLEIERSTATRAKKVVVPFRVRIVSRNYVGAI